jgi:O-glycosyl hydrolase
MRLLALLLFARSTSTTAGATIPLNGETVAHVFDGVGGLSAGASSRLLIDYPEPQRSQVLDALFLPNYGLALQILKVEIGGDTQSTDGTEASHQHSRGDLGCARGYETWLMLQAKARNPAIKTFGLSWGVPGWIGNGSYFTPDNWAYQTAWLQCQRSLGIQVDYLGVWNERFWGGIDYVSGLRATLDAAGFASTRIVIPDGGYDGSIMSDGSNRTGGGRGTLLA